QRSSEWDGHPVGSVPISETFAGQLQELNKLLPHTEFRDEIVEGLNTIWAPGRTIGEAFCTHIQRLFRERGLIVVDPLNDSLKNLVVPIYANAASRSQEIVDALVSRSE